MRCCPDGGVEPRAYIGAQQPERIEFIQRGVELEIGPGPFGFLHLLLAGRAENESEEVGLFKSEGHVGAAEALESVDRALGVVAGMGREHPGHSLIERGDAAGPDSLEEGLLVGEVVVGRTGRDPDGLGHSPQGEVLSAAGANVGQGLIDHGLGKGPVVIGARRRLLNIDNVHLACQPPGMNSVQSSALAPSSASDSKGLARWAGALSLVQGLLLFVPLTVLGAAINWPESLSDPAEIALPRILEQESGVRLGYVSYLIYSVLFAVTMILLVRYAKSRKAMGLGSMITGFSIASTVARCIGIIRWLVPVPVLAELYAATADESERTAISVAFEALNSFGGTIGEVLGVSIFAAIAIGLFAIAVLKTKAMPAWLGIFGLIAALSILATAVELIGIDASTLIFLGTTVVQLWFLAIGIWLLLRGGRPAAAAQG